MLPYILFCLGFVVLIKGADLLVEGSGSLAKRLKISDLVIGLTIVAMGSSAPELIVNVMASLEEKSDLAFGNIIGSNIANILLILGVSATIFPLAVRQSTLFLEIPFKIFTVLLLGYLANHFFIGEQGALQLSQSGGWILLFGFLVYMAYVWRLSRKQEFPIEEPEIQNMLLSKTLVYIVLGLLGLALGGKWIVEGAEVIVKNLGFSEGFVGLTIVSLGTSMPELAASAVAAYKKSADIAIGNIVGSNIFNILFVLGISATIHPIDFDPKHNIDLLINLGAGVLLFALPLLNRERKLQRKDGVLFIIFYLAYIAWLYSEQV